jgi:ABC-2 type transport system permease protein
VPSAGDDLLHALQSITYADGKPLLIVNLVSDKNAAEMRLKNREASLLVIIPTDFSAAIDAIRKKNDSPTTTLTVVGDLTNPTYAVGAMLANAALDQYMQAITGQPRPIQIVEEAIGASGARTEFENYVPGLLVFAVMMLMFLAAISVVREVEGGTLRRLQTTSMTAFDYFGGLSLSLALIGTAAVTLTFLVALALGFRSQGPLWLAIMIGIITSFSVIGVGLMVACFVRTSTQAFLIVNFPLALFMFFSGAIFPIPRVPLFVLAGRMVGLYDILPPTHAVVALNKILTLGAGLDEVLYELGALVLLSAVYFAVGVWLFQRTHLRLR